MTDLADAFAPLAMMSYYPAQVLKHFTAPTVLGSESGVLWGDGTLNGDATADIANPHRLALWRTWSERGGICCFVALNPSTANYTTDDPTVRRMKAFAQQWGFGSLLVLNAFSLRSTDPKLLYVDASPSLDANDWVIRIGVGFAHKTILAWGSHGRLYNRGRKICSILLALSHRCYCLGRTKAGDPRHPLYLAGSTVPTVYLAPAAGENHPWPVRPPQRTKKSRQAPTRPD